MNFIFGMAKRAISAGCVDVLPMFYSHLKSRLCVEFQDNDDLQTYDCYRLWNDVCVALEKTITLSLILIALSGEHTGLFCFHVLFCPPLSFSGVEYFFNVKSIKF